MCYCLIVRYTARAIIIRDRKLLLVTGHGASYYWSPGGGIENNETPLLALGRELLEELGVQVKSAKPYLSYIIEENQQQVDNFLVVITGEIKPSSEITGIIWLSKDMFINKPITVSLGLVKKLMPALIKDGLL